MKSIRLLALSLSLAGIVGGPLSQPAVAGTAAELNASGKAALDRLYAQSDRARRYSRDARAILVFPKIIKAGFMIGGQGGEGVLSFTADQPAITRSAPPPSAFRPVGSPSATRCS